MAEASGAVRLVTLGVSASVAVEPVANRSSWGTVPPGRACDQADLGEYAAPLVPAHSTPTLTPSQPYHSTPTLLPIALPRPPLHNTDPNTTPGACGGGAAAARATQLVRLRGSRGGTTTPLSSP